MEYTIVSLEDCDTTLANIRGEGFEQWAYTNLDEKPDGEGWQDKPRVDLDINSDRIGLIWSRPYRYAVSLEDTQPLTPVTAPVGELIPDEAA